MQTLDQLSGDIWITTVNLDDFEVRAVLIAGEERVVVWDSLSHPDDMRLFLPMIGDRDLVVIYSHADWDHVWGTAGLPRDRMTSIGHALCAERFRTDVPRVLAEKMAEDPVRWGPVKLVPPAVTFDGQYAVSLGSTTLHLHHLPGHTPDSIAGFLPERGVLLLGDAVETPLPLVPEACDLNRWIEELLRWQAEPGVRMVIPSHGPIGGREILAQNIVYLQNLLAGREIPVPALLDDFYREAHLANVRAWCNKGRK
jgi:glyoxylase-like metal-dependent hydrolase (beta-lactamase superfamily II)